MELVEPFFSPPLSRLPRLDLHELRSRRAIVRTLPLAFDLYSVLRRRMTPARIGPRQRALADLRQHRHLHRSPFGSRGIRHGTGLDALQAMACAMDSRNLDGRMF